MIKIAHRGNITGPNPDFENDPVNLGAAISRGYDVEVDIWMNESGIFLGHDAPTHKVDESFLEDIKNEAWFHCKNIEALGYFSNHMPDAKYFWHEEDKYTLTSNGYIWTYPGNTLTNKSIVVIKEEMDLSIFDGVYGVCTDYWEMPNEPDDHII
jgi:hypothetical protein